jgi:hypothetical protein
MHSFSINAICKKGVRTEKEFPRLLFITLHSGTGSDEHYRFQIKVRNHLEIHTILRNNNFLTVTICMKK